MGKETVIQRDILDYLTGQGFLAWRNHIQGIRLNGKRLANPNKGQPDIWAVKNGRLLGVEVKADTPLSKEQVEWLEKAARFGVPIIVAHSVQEVRETLVELRDKLTSV